MPGGPVLQPSVNSTPFASVLANIVTRLGTIPGSGPIRTSAVPDDALTPYLAQPGFVIRPYAPEPIVGTGAGRYGLLAYRNIEVWVITQSFSDYAGDDTTAIAAHSSAEEQVIDALSLVPWGGQAFQTPVIAIECFWIPGGRPMTRTVKEDLGILTSSLLFRVKYTVPCTVVGNS